MIRTTLPVLLLLASAAPASAECAWVLWSRECTPSAPPGATWVIDDTAQTRAQCDMLLSKAIARFPIGSDVFNVFPDTVIYSRDGVVSARNYKCLPDTVDPRGPKGK